MAAVMLNDEEIRALAEQLKAVAPKAKTRDDLQAEIAELENENQGLHSENEGLRHEIAQFGAMLREVCKEHGIDPEGEYPVEE
jgi:regulator of replication initiation timing